MAYISSVFQGVMDEIVIRSISFVLTTGMMWSARTFVRGGYGRRATLQPR
jgi:hypothetical protein